MKEFNESMIENYREFNNGGMFEIDGYTVKFDNRSKTLETEYPYAEDLRLWWFDIEEETKKLSISDIEGLQFELVDTFPKGYEVWNVNTNGKYLPLCETDKNFNVNVDTLKCIKLESDEDVQCVLKAMQYFKKRTHEALKKYFKKYDNNYCTLNTMFKVKRASEALEALKKVGIE